MRPMMAVLAASALVLPASAHHSHAMFDDAQEVTVTGVIAGIRYTNPHVYLLVGVAGETGKVVNWAVEMSNVGRMMSLGVTADTFRVGQQVVVAMNPLRSGSPGGNYTRIVSIDGLKNTGEGQAWRSAD